MRRLSLMIACSTLLLTGCSSPTEGDGTVNGEWSASEFGFAVTTDLTQVGTIVSGNGTINSVYGNYAFTVTGTFISPNLSATLSAPGRESITFAGTLDGNSLDGTLNGHGLSNYAVTLTR